LVALLIALHGCAKPAPTPTEISADSIAHLTVDALSRRDIDSLASLAHPTAGVRFSPYGHVDTTSDRRLTPNQLRAQWSKPDSLVWGIHDGSGEPIRLSFRQYIDRFVYDFDALHAPRVARDSAPMGTGNSIFNVREVYPADAVVEFNTPGTDPKYGGMDWRSLWIVLRRLDDRWVVVAIVHGAWTI
jgi:hypothetical protein